jgi:site-specific DNA-methyltransferase (adenine-specific)
VIIIPLAKLEVRARQRTSILPGPLKELRDSILATGLLHPPVAWRDDSTATWVLTAGERRLRAIQAIAAENRQFCCGEAIINPGDIPISLLGDYLNAEGRFEAELDENIHRADLDWKDRARAFADLHALRQQQNPAQTIAATATEIASKSNSHTPASAGNAIRHSTTIVAHLHNEKVASARNAKEALQHIYRMEEEKVLAALAKRQIASMRAEERTLEVRHADCFHLLPRLAAGTYDLVVADPPYGIDASSGGFRARTVLHHNYEDTAQSARDMAQVILTEGFRLTKNRANLLIFCDIDLFPWLKTAAANMGWTPFRRPLIWQKSESEGLAPWGSQGPRITTEFIFFATKGQKGMTASPIDVFNIRRVPRNERIHAAEKPVELLKKLIEATTLPGDSVLDPCCGSGSTLVACKELSRRAFGIEKDPDYYTTAVANVFGGDAPSATDELAL